MNRKECGVNQKNPVARGESRYGTTGLRDLESDASVITTGPLAPASTRQAFLGASVEGSGTVESAGISRGVGHHSKGARFIVIRANCEELAEGARLPLSIGRRVGSGSYGSVSEVLLRWLLPSETVIKVSRKSRPWLDCGLSPEDLFLGDRSYQQLEAEYHRTVSAATIDVCPRPYAFGFLCWAPEGPHGAQEVSPAILMEDARREGFMTLREAMAGGLEASCQSAAEVGLLLLERLELLQKLERPILHHDLSDNNIMVSLRGASVGSLMLIDFGQSSYVGEKVPPLFDTSGVCTPEYASPETLQFVDGTMEYRHLETFTRLREGRNSAPSDLYSIGPVLFSVRKGTRPRLTNRRNTWSNLRDKESGHYLDLASPSNNGDIELGAVIKGCTKFEPDNRWLLDEARAALRDIAPLPAQIAAARRIRETEAARTAREAETERKARADAAARLAGVLRAAAERKARADAAARLAGVLRAAAESPRPIVRPVTPLRGCSLSQGIESPTAEEATASAAAA